MTEEQNVTVTVEKPAHVVAYEQQIRTAKDDLAQASIKEAQTAAHAKYWRKERERLTAYLTDLFNEGPADPSLFDAAQDAAKQTSQNPPEYTDADDYYDRRCPACGGKGCDDDGIECLDCAGNGVRDLAAAEEAEQGDDEAEEAPETGFVEGDEEEQEADDDDEEEPLI